VTGHGFLPTGNRKARLTLAVTHYTGQQNVTFFCPTNFSRWT